MIDAQQWLPYAIGGAFLLLGLIVGYILANSKLNSSVKKLKDSSIKETEIKAESIKQEKILQAKEKFLQLKAEHDKQITNRNNEIVKNENRSKQQVAESTKKLDDIVRKEKDVDHLTQNLQGQIDSTKKKQEDLEKMHRQQVDTLQKITGMSADDAKNQLIESVKAEAKTDAPSFVGSQ